MYAIHTNQVVRRQTLRRKSTLSSLLFGEDEADALKSKNIKQTELVAALWPRWGRRSAAPLTTSTAWTPATLAQ